MFLKTKFKYGDSVIRRGKNQGTITAIIRRCGKTIYEIDNSFEEVESNLKHAEIFEKNSGDPYETEKRFRAILSEEMTAYMEKNKISRAELSKELGVGVTFMIDILNQNQKLSLHVFNKLLLALGRKVEIKFD